MSLPESCNNALEHLRRALEAGTSLDSETSTHLSECLHCKTTLKAALHALEPVPEQEPDPPATDPIEAEVLRHHGHRLILKGFMAGVILVMLAAVIMLVNGGLEASFLLVPMMVMPLMLLVALLFFLVRVPAYLGIYKRLSKGRMLSGVCLGLAQRTQLPVWAWRLAFLLLSLVYGMGFWIYVLLDLAMPVHPEDRPNLLRYRISRWWRRIRSAA